MRDYGKVQTSFWTSTTMRALSEDARMLALYLITSPHSTITGVFRLPDGYVCEDLQWDAERVAKGFVQLLAKGFANRCETTKWVWVCAHLEWNPPENPNQRKSAAKVASAIPDQCQWKPAFMRDCGPLLDLPPWSPPNPCETLLEGFLNQEQEQEQKQEQKQLGAIAPSSPAKLPTCQPQKIVDLYHEVLPELPGVRVMDKAREKAIRDRWQWVLTTSKPDGARRATTGEEAIDWFRSYFGRARDNDFLMGRTPKSEGHSNWKPDIEYLMKSAGLKQVLEKTHTENA